KGANPFIHSTGTQNTFVGEQAGNISSTATRSTAIGYQALKAVTYGSNNTAVGNFALLANQDGYYNTAIGDGALSSNISGNNNVGIGISALLQNTAGYSTAIGVEALYTNTTGDYNTAIGYQADVSTNNLTNATAIGANAIVDASDKIRLGDSYVTVIEGQVAYTYPSDGRFKFNIQENIKGLAFIRKLRPISYQFDTQKFDAFISQKQSAKNRKKRLKETNFSASKAMIHNGFIAQEVEKAAQESHFVFDGIKKPQHENETYSLGYSQFVVPLVKAVQEQQQLIEKQQQMILSQNRINQQQSQAIAQLQQQIKQLMLFIKPSKTSK
ncbi:MAG: hypothetical protein RL637_1267, partial [Pseudomonadota bacterium]